MKKIKNLTFFSILPVLFLFFFIIQMPTSFVKKIRIKMLETMIPLQRGFQKVLFFFPSQEVVTQLCEEKALKEKMATVLLLSEMETEKLKTQSNVAEECFLQLKEERFITDLSEAIASRVIFREIRSYNNAIWIDRGTSSNDACGREIIAVNSPVLSNGVLVGVVDEVFENYSRIRLITDKKLTPSVRALRGGSQERYILFNLLMALENVHNLFSVDKNKNHHLITMMESLEKEIASNNLRSCLLAKGELKGSLVSSMRCPSLLIEGVGFNCQFEEDWDQKDPNILNTNDLLITTGLDGIFPPNIPVAVVTKVKNIKNGELFYNIEAKLLATDIFFLQNVSVLPSKKFTLCH